MTTLDLLQNVTLGIVLVCISVFVQVMMTLLVLRFFPRLALLVERRPSYWHTFCALACLILAIIIGNLFQMHIWGMAFYLLSYFAEFWTAQHFAAQTYTTLGYGDILLPPERRLLAGWLALTGLLMVGWSTALFAYLVTKYADAHPFSDESTWVSGHRRRGQSTYDRAQAKPERDLTYSATCSASSGADHRPHVSR